jgi:hypothetical protein
MNAAHLTPLLAAGLLAACGLPAPAPETPVAIAAPTGEAPLMTLAATGVQVYECRAAAGGAEPAWTFVAPEAELFDAQGRSVGTHGAGPHWQAHDGSRLLGKVRARARVDVAGAAALPWLLLDAEARGPAGAFSGVTRIQRVRTVGGLAPASGCRADTTGAVARVPYTADYVLFSAGRL